MYCVPSLGPIDPDSNPLNLWLGIYTLFDTLTFSSSELTDSKKNFADNIKASLTEWYLEAINEFSIVESSE